MKRYLPFAIVASVFLIAVTAGTSLSLWKQRVVATKAVSPGKLGAEPAHVLGSIGARVRIEEFADFQCPSCAALAPALSHAKQKYRDKVCIVFREFPLAEHEHAQNAACAAEAAGLQNRFWEMHDLLFGSQLAWTRVVDTRELFNQFAKSVGLDVERFKIDQGSEQVKARIAADLERAVSLGVNRTPAIFINDARLPDPSLNQKSLEESIEAAVEPKAR